MVTYGLFWFCVQCDRLCGEGKETRQVTCYRKVDGQIEVLDSALCEAKEKKPDTKKSCNLRPCEGVDWVASEWSGVSTSISSSFSPSFFLFSLLFLLFFILLTVHE